MKNKTMLGMTAMPVSFETAGGEGGGGGGGSAAAVATPPAASAAPIATGRTAGPGMFGGGKVPALKTLPDALKPATTAADGGDKGVAVVTTAAGSEGDAGKAGAEGSGSAAVTPNPEALARLGMGRFKTLTEFEEGYRRTEVEASRLHQENKTLQATHQKEIADRDTQLAILKAELETARTTPAFKELSKEELEALAKENPVAAADYISEKKFRDRDAKAQKEKTEAEVRNRQTRLADTLRKIDERSNAMLNDHEGFPQYEEMIPVMQELLEKTSTGDYNPIRGNVWGGELFYLAAMGLAYKQAIKAGKGAQGAAAEAAKTKAAADAAATKGPAGDSKGSGAADGNAVETEKKNFNAAILSAAPRRVFQKK